jgi:hypothetical protein
MYVLLVSGKIRHVAYDLQSLEHLSSAGNTSATVGKMKEIETAVSTLQQTVQGLLEALHADKPKITLPVLRCDMCTQVTPITRVDHGLQHSSSPRLLHLPATQCVFAGSEAERTYHKSAQAWAVGKGTAGAAADAPRCTTLGQPRHAGHASQAQRLSAIQTGAVQRQPAAATSWLRGGHSLHGNEDEQQSSNCASASPEVQNGDPVMSAPGAKCQGKTIAAKLAAPIAVPAASQAARLPASGRIHSKHPAEVCSRLLPSLLC